MKSQRVAESHVNDYLEVVQAIYYDACTRCAAEASVRDLLTIRSRVESQGVSFLTITLPNFASDFERSLESGFVDPKLFRSFRKNGAIPAFMQGMLGRIFNKETGRIFDDKIHSSPDNIAYTVESIRQICLTFKKIKLPCTPKREQQALENFIKVEHSFKMFSLSTEDDTWFSSVSSVLWDNVMFGLQPNVAIPRHGPGSTAEKLSGNRKFIWHSWHERLEPYFPLLDSIYSATCGELGRKSEELEIVSLVPEEDEQPVRVTPVPKTLKGPRIIAIEPCCMQYAQQGLMHLIIKVLETSGRTAGHINFRDQTVNQLHAMTSSYDSQLATIDLSDASDRVPLDLALRMFRSNPSMRDAIDACRSKKAELPDGRIVNLSKFASMGSALCFPIEAMYFYTICVVALLRLQNLPVSHANADLVSRDIYIYGDDILVPSMYAASVLDYLRKYNCKVNDRKTFYLGRFRESCGVDAFCGKLVTPVYLRSVPPKNRQQASEIISWVSTANQFFQKGYLKTSQLLFRKVEKILGNLPWVSPTSQALGRHHPWTSVVPKRYNKRYQRLEIKCWIPREVYRTDRLSGYAALQKSLVKLEGLENLLAQRDRFHLERSALRNAVAIKRCWVPASITAGHLW